MLAHAGHWLASLIYVIPVAGLIGYLGLQTLRDRRARRDAADSETRHETL
jgi:hypothetical protein